MEAIGDLNINEELIIEIEEIGAISGDREEISDKDRRLILKEAISEKRNELSKIESRNKQIMENWETVIRKSL